MSPVGDDAAQPGPEFVRFTQNLELFPGGQPGAVVTSCAEDTLNPLHCNSDVAGSAAQFNGSVSAMPSFPSRTFAAPPPQGTADTLLYVRPSSGRSRAFDNYFAIPLQRNSVMRYSLFVKANLTKILLAAAALCSGELSLSFAANGKLAAGQYTGAGQVMVLTNREVRYGENLGICHIRIAEDGSLEVDFPGERTTLQLEVVNTEPRTVWKVAKGDKTFQATAIPFSPELYAFRLEILQDGKLMGGAQQFFSLPKRTEPVQVERLSKDGKVYYETGRDAVLTCVIVNDTKNLRRLIAEGQDLKTPLLGSKEGWSFLHFAARHAHPEVVKLLLENGADVNARTAAGTTALSIAQEGAQGKHGDDLVERSRKVVDLLRRHGAE